MKVLDKNNVLQGINNRETEKVVLELGCGNTRKFETSITLDIVDQPGVDIVCNLNEGFPFINDNSVDEIHSEHFLEHVADMGFMMHEIHRVLKKGARKFFTVPHFSNPYYFSDYTHKIFFGLYSMSYFSKNSYFKRKVPTFYNDIDFKIICVEYIFKSRWIFPGFITKRFGKLLNKSKFLQEYYEAHYSNVVPCSELFFIIEKV